MTINADPPAAAASAATAPQPAHETQKLRSPERLVLAATLVGLAADGLFYAKPLGISFPLFIGLAAVGLFVVGLGEQARPSGASLWLVLPMAGFAVMASLRAEPLTQFVNVCASFGLGLLWIRTYGIHNLFRFGLFDYIAHGVAGGLEAVFRPLPVLVDTGRHSLSPGGRRHPLLPVLRGLLLATPVVCLFSALLSSADLVFADGLKDLLEVLNLDNIPELLTRLTLISLASFLALGLAMQALRPRRLPLIGAEGELVPRILGPIESAIVLGAVNSLFAAFVIIQFRYLFGGTANITEAGYTYSEYARRGFGEVAAVVFITLLILLQLASVVRLDPGRDKVVFNLLNVATVALVGIMVISALQRLLLYEEIFGFTRLRTYAHVAIIWLGALFAPYLLALLAGRLRWFAPGALLAALGFVASLNAINVDHFIAARNTQRFSRGLDLHVRYLLTLSDDALPELLALYDRADPEINAVLGPGLACRVDQTESGYAQAAWQSTHFSSRSALQLLRTRQRELGGHRVIHHPYGNYVFLEGKPVRCRELLQSYILEPGLTGEYR